MPGSKNSSTRAHANPRGWVDTLGQNDILFGRGSGPNVHEGNIRFRDLVKKRKAEYISAPRPAKATIAQEIVDATRANGSRFLKTADANDMDRLEIPQGIQAWCIMDDQAVLEKAKQALRAKSKSPKTVPDWQAASDDQKPVHTCYPKETPDPPRSTLTLHDADFYPAKNKRFKMASSLKDEPQIDLEHILGDLEPLLDWQATSDNQEPVHTYYPKKIPDSPRSTLALLEAEIAVLEKAKQALRAKNKRPKTASSFKDEPQIDLLSVEHILDDLEPLRLDWQGTSNNQEPVHPYYPKEIHDSTRSTLALPEPNTYPIAAQSTFNFDGDLHAISTDNETQVRDISVEDFEGQQYHSLVFLDEL